MSPRVNYIRHLNAFFKHVKYDDRLQANDISLYMALFQTWNMHNFRNSFPILREEIMQLSCIGSRSTYMNCMKRLHACGYINYQQSTKKYALSKISVIWLAEAPKQNTTQLSLFEEGTGPNNEPDAGPKTGPHTRPNNGPQSGPKVGHLNKHVNKNKVESKGSPKKKVVKNEVQKETPQIQQVQEYFSHAGYPDKEARKYFFHYQAIGWTLSGSPILDWQAAAAKWIENIKTTKNGIKPGKLHVNTDDKSYNNAF
jgi:hypothetical protein